MSQSSLEGVALFEEIGGLERAQGVGVDMPGDFDLSASVAVGIKRDVAQIELEVLFAVDQVVTQT
jgi:hypothetical protein